MMVPQLSEAQVKRLRKAYYLGCESHELGKRFGVSSKEIPQIARGDFVPLVYVVGDGSAVTKDDERFLLHNRIKSCRLHLLDLVTEYRPDVLTKLRERRKAALAASVVSKINIEKKDKNNPTVETNDNDNCAIPVSRIALNPHSTKRSWRIFVASLERFNMTANEMTGQARTRVYAQARQITMFVIYSECSKFESTPSIGRMFKKDHSTVVHAVHKIRARYLAGDQEIVEHVNALKEVP